MRSGTQRFTSSEPGVKGIGAVLSCPLIDGKAFRFPMCPVSMRCNTRSFISDAVFPMRCARLWPWVDCLEQRVLYAAGAAATVGSSFHAVGTVPFAVSADGSTVVGSDERGAFRWTLAGGI